MKQGYWLILSLVVLILDQISKYYVSLHLQPYNPLPIWSWFNITLAYNSGAAFSFLSSAGDWHRWFFAVFNLTVSIVLMLWLVRGKLQGLLQLTGVSFIIGGALGNLVDRGLHGHVIDFIDLHYQHHHFATFNIADSAICIGAGLLVLDLLRRKA